jgi:O-antigen ligase
MKNNSFVEKALSYLVIFTVFIVPLAVFSGRLYPFISSKSFLFMGLAEVCFFSFVYLLTTKKQYCLSKNQYLAFSVPILLAVSMGLSAIFSSIPNLAFWGSFERATGFVFWVHCLAFAFVVASLVKVHGQEFLDKIYKSIFYSGIILAISTFINANFINIPSLFLFDGPNSADLSGNSSFSGAYLIFSLFIGSLIFFNKNKKNNRFLVFLGSLIILLSPVVGKARGALFGILIGAIVSFCVFLISGTKKSLRLIGTGLLAFVLVFGVYGSINLVKEGTKLNQAFIEATTNSRLVFWESAIKGIKERPVLGWGQENYGALFGRYFDSRILEPGSTMEIWSDKPHNSIVESFVNGGFVGGVLYIFLFALLVFLPIFLFRKGKITRISMTFFVGMIVAYLIQDMFLFDTVPALMMIFLLLGIFIGLLSDTNITSSKEKSDTVKAVVGLLLTFSFVVTWVNFVYNPLKKSKEIIQSLNIPTDRQENLRKALAISPMGNSTDIAYVASNMLSAYRKNSPLIMKDDKVKQSTLKEIDDFLATVDSLKEKSANVGRLWLTSAELINFKITISGETTQQEIDRAIEYLEKSEKVLIGNPKVYWTYGQLYLNIEDYKKAYEYYKKAYEINPKVKMSLEYVQKFEELFGNKIK